MSIRREVVGSCLYSVLTFVIILLMAVLMFLLSSCGATKDMPVERVVERVEYIDRIKIDSIYEKQYDSIYIKERNDTIVIHKDSERETFKYVFIHDTLNVTRVDSIPHIIYIEKEKEISTLKKLRIFGYIFLFFIILIFTAYVVRKFFK